MSCTLEITISDKIGGSSGKKDSVIITIDIGPLGQDQQMFKLKKVLIDTGSSVDVTYFTTIKKLSTPLDDLHQPLNSLFGFSGEQMWPIG